MRVIRSVVIREELHKRPRIRSSYHSNAHAQPLSGVTGQIGSLTLYLYICVMKAEPVVTGLSVYLSAVPFSSLCVRIERALAMLSKMTTDKPNHDKTIKMA